MLAENLRKATIVSLAAARSCACASQKKHTTNRGFFELFIQLI